MSHLLVCYREKNSAFFHIKNIFWFWCRKFLQQHEISKIVKKYIFVPKNRFFTYRNQKKCWKSRADCGGGTLVFLGDFLSTVGGGSSWDFCRLWGVLLKFLSTVGGCFFFAAGAAGACSERRSREKAAQPPGAEGAPPGPAARRKFFLGKNDFSRENSLGALSKHSQKSTFHFKNVHFWTDNFCFQKKAKNFREKNRTFFSKKKYYFFRTKMKKSNRKKNKIFQHFGSFWWTCWRLFSAGEVGGFFVFKIKMKNSYVYRSCIDLKIPKMQ